MRRRRLAYRNAKEEAEFQRGPKRGAEVWTPSKRRAVLTRYRKTEGYWDIRYQNGEEGILQPKDVKLAEEE